MVKDRKVKRNYQEGQDGQLKRSNKKVKFDEDENDTSCDDDDLDGVTDTAILVKAKKLAACERLKIVLNQVKIAVQEDRMNWLVFYASFVNQMMKEELGTIITIWLAFFVQTQKTIAGDAQLAEGEQEGWEMTQEEVDDKNTHINLIA